MTEFTSFQDCNISYVRVTLVLTSGLSQHGQAQQFMSFLKVGSAQQGVQGFCGTCSYIHLEHLWLSPDDMDGSISHALARSYELV